MKYEITIPKKTFLNQPYFNRRENADALVSFMGVCLNSSHEIYGSENAPNSIRDVSERYSNSDGSAQPLKIYNPNKGYLLEEITIQDTGDLIFRQEMTIKKMEQLIIKEMKKIHNSGSFPVIVGGDHYITYPIISSYNSDLTIVQFDAHGDYLNNKNCLNGSVIVLFQTLSDLNENFFVTIFN